MYFDLTAMSIPMLVVFGNRCRFAAHLLPDAAQSDIIFLLDNINEELELRVR